MSSLTSVLLAVTLTALPAPWQSKEHERLTNSGTVLEEVLRIPENVPEEILNKAQCVIVIPSLTKVALGIGGSYGRGAMVCRSGAAHNGPWGAPAMYAIEGASVGFQFGAEATDLVLMVMNSRGVNALLTSAVKLGAQASVAAGPKGRHVEAATDASMRAELLSYSRSRGLFAGVSIEGTSLRPDDDANEQVYGRRISAKDIINGTGMTVPESARRLVDTLQKYSPRAIGLNHTERTR
jgi:lipid-binding SYLF domain-containing protein